MNRIQLAGYSLIASAFVLAGLLTFQIQQTPAHGAMVVTEPNFAAMTAKTRPNEEGLFVLDNTTGFLLIYRANLANDELNLQRVVNLNDLMGGGQGSGGRGAGDRRSR